MTSYKKHLSIALSLLALTCAAGLAEQPPWPERNLKFESPTPPVQPRPHRVPSAVTHMAVVIIGCKGRPIDNLHLDVASDSPNGDPSQLLQTPAGHSMSDQQRKLLAAKEYLIQHRPFRSDDGSYKAYDLYAVSEEDARKMATALVELCDAKVRAKLDEIRKRLDDLRKLIPETEKKIAEIDARTKAASAECMELRKIVSYRHLEDALQDVVELDKALRSVDVDLAAIQAKTDAISKLKTPLPIDSPHRTALDQMLFAQDVDRAGALARRNAIEGHRKTAQQYCDLEQRRQDDDKTRNTLAPKLKSSERALPEYEKTLAEPPDYMKPVIVLSNTAQIYPLSPPPASAPSSMPPPGR